MHPATDIAYLKHIHISKDTISMQIIQNFPSNHLSIIGYLHLLWLMRNISRQPLYDAIP